MSVDINWETLTGGPGGEELAEIVRDFIHERFQHVSLPKLIRSVKVHAFDFGNVAPQIVLKDVCEPLPDFYDADAEGEDDEIDDVPQDLHTGAIASHSAGRHPRSKDNSRRASEQDLFDQAASPSLTRGAILGSTSNFGYFHLSGFPGTSTPLAAVAGAHFPNGLQHSEQQHKTQIQPIDAHGSPTTSSASPPSRPVSRDQVFLDSLQSSGLRDGLDDDPAAAPTHGGTAAQQVELDRSPEDLQVVFHVTYAGDVRLSMTAEVFLDYPMPSFVGIPLKLNITGLTFNGVGILAYIRKRAHLCFLSPEDAEALVGSEGAGDGEDDAPTGTGSGADPTAATQNKGHVGALLEEIKIESEMGESGEGKQVLKNVGKIEKFILEQVQRIFEDEFVYPSFWTFLV